MTQDRARLGNRATGRQPRSNKYGVGQASDRMFDGVLFASRAEGQRWVEWNLMLRAGNVIKVERQVRIPLGADTITIVDFVLTKPDGSQFAEEVKGFETPAFKRIRRLWPRYGPFPMQIATLAKRTWSFETIPGGT